MKFIRFVFPFLFVRNWYNGSWELSTARLLTVSAIVVLCALGLIIAYMLQAPVVYNAGV